MTKSMLRYDRLIEDALRGVVRQVLADAAEDGLPGAHHFYITFKTQAPGVDIPTRLVERFPDVIDLNFTANMEGELHEIARGGKAWQPVVRDRLVSPALRAYAVMTTSAAHGAVRDVSKVGG